MTTPELDNLAGLLNSLDSFQFPISKNNALQTKRPLSNKGELVSLKNKLSDWFTGLTFSYQDAKYKKSQRGRCSRI